MQIRCSFLCKLGIAHCSGIINAVIIVFVDPENICIDTRMTSPWFAHPEIRAKTRLNGGHFEFMQIKW